MANPAEAPLVTAVLPTYNGADFIQRTLDSLAAQTWPNLEILIGDDRSTDDTLLIVEYGAGRVTRATLDGRVLGRFGSTGPNRGQFSTPWGMTVDSRGRIRIADTGNRRIVGLVR